MKSDHLLKDQLICVVATGLQPPQADLSEILIVISLPITPEDI
jgi:hypothetical protein